MKSLKQKGSTQRHNELVGAVKKYLDLKNIFYISSWGIKCRECGNIQRVSPAGCDIVIASHLVEVKTGGSQLTPRQRIVEEKAGRYGVPYTIIRNSVDDILGAL